MRVPQNAESSSGKPSSGKSHARETPSDAVMRVLDVRSDPAARELTLPRSLLDFASARDAARTIVEDVRDRGLTAVLETTAKFDGVELSSLLVPPVELERAWAETPEPLRRAFETAISRVRKAHTFQLPVSGRVELGDGAIVEQSYVPVQRVGLYAPGGLAAYASSVIMNVVPAQVAGVESIAVASPPQRETGLPAASVLAACHALGIEEVYAMGGAQAIAAFAYGLEDAGSGDALRQVDVITGPGNAFVAAAKSIVRGQVAIDAEAGPTEIAIVADDTADARFVAADLLSQAEHDPLAASILITDSERLANEVGSHLATRLAATPNSERARQALQGEQSLIVLTDSVETSLAIANGYGAEHLEILTEDPREAARSIRHAGAIFLGPWSPVSLGDYAAGSNHVLPTSGTARFASGLSVLTFLRPVQLIEYSQAGLTEVADHVITLAEAERLPAHGAAVRERLLA